MFGAWRRGSASALGAESRWFKSSRPDHFGVVTVCRDSFFLFVVRRRLRRSTALNPRKGSDSAKLCAFWSEGHAVVQRLGVAPQGSPGDGGQAAPPVAGRCGTCVGGSAFCRVFTGNFRRGAEEVGADFPKNRSLECNVFSEAGADCRRTVRRRGGKKKAAQALARTERKNFFRLVLSRRELRQNDGRKMKTCCPGMFFFTSA